MGQLKDIWTGEHTGFVRYATILTLIFLFYVGFFSHASLWRWAKSGVELRRQRNQIERLQNEINAMDSQIQMLSNDRDSLEEFARENFYFAAPGDDVYIYE